MLPTRAKIDAAYKVLQKIGPVIPGVYLLWKTPSGDYVLTGHVGLETVLYAFGDIGKHFAGLTKSGERLGDTNPNTRSLPSGERTLVFKTGEVVMDPRDPEPQEAAPNDPRPEERQPEPTLATVQPQEPAPQLPVPAAEEHPSSAGRDPGGSSDVPSAP